MSTYPVVTFRRVFDTSPEREVLTLDELAAAFCRFEVKEDLQKKLDREYARLNLALDRAMVGQFSGKWGAKIHTWLESHDAKELNDFASKEKEHIAAEAKQDLRLWSPALYREDAVVRGTDSVSHLSCLVLDIDDGVSFEAARLAFGEWFYFIHSTWSYSLVKAKFRIILPLSGLVAAHEWKTVWQWGAGQVGGASDNAMSGVAATYALPAIGKVDAPCFAETNPGRFFDPASLGVRTFDFELRPTFSEGSVMRGDPEKKYIELAQSRVHVYSDVDEAEAENFKTSVVTGATIVTTEASDRDTLSELSTEQHVEQSAKAEVTTAKVRPEAPVRPKRPRKTSLHLAVDFDGVLHAYTTPWISIDVISDPPVQGAIEWLTSMLENARVTIFSARCAQTRGIAAMQAWFIANGLSDILADKVRFAHRKPKADVFIDDRGYRFEGTFPDLAFLEALKPWNKAQ